MIMKFSFGILTNNQCKVNKVVESIFNQRMSTSLFEIIICGDVKHIWKHHENVRVICHPKCEERKHITKKKNIIIENCANDIVILMKDYLRLDAGWYDGMMRYGCDFDILMNKIESLDGKRYLDWIWENPKIGMGRNIPYNISRHDGMFAPGAFVIAKKYVFEDHKFDESLVGIGKPTDVKWSQRAFKQYSYKMNVHSKCVMIERQRRYPKFRQMCICSTCKNN